MHGNRYTYAQMSFDEILQTNTPNDAKRETSEGLDTIGLKLLIYI